MTQSKQDLTDQMLVPREGSKLSRISAVPEIPCVVPFERTVVTFVGPWPTPQDAEFQLEMMMAGPRRSDIRLIGEPDLSGDTLRVNLYSVRADEWDMLSPGQPPHIWGINAGVLVVSGSRIMVVRRSSAGRDPARWQPGPAVCADPTLLNDGPGGLLWASARRCSASAMAHGRRLAKFAVFAPSTVGGLDVWLWTVQSVSDLGPVAAESLASDAFDGVGWWEPGHPYPFPAMPGTAATLEFVAERIFGSHERVPLHLPESPTSLL